MGSPAADRVVGIDAAGKYGWVGVLLDSDGFVGAHHGALSVVIEWAEPVVCIGVDIPIGSIPGGIRLADAEARRFVGQRASSVFSAPPDEALGALSYEDANARLISTGATRISRQAWALVPKINEAEVIAAGDSRVHEVHPEVSFRAMAGEHLAWSKKSWNGLLLRRRLLAEQGIALPDPMPDLASVIADDVVDAAAAAWSARRIAAGAASSLPSQPEEHDGRLVAIWF